MFGRIGTAATAIASALAKAFPVVVRDCAGIAGFGLISYGSWLIAPAAGFIVAGMLLLGGVLLASRRQLP